ncbi:MAG: response regulator [Marinilabiliales bacterium]|nr:response regulator [Marinilabiliales bacterium]
MINLKENLKILLIEDNLLNQRLMCINLAKYNCSITLANNGLEGVNQFKSGKYDVILMDLMMPVMDGFESAIEIRKLEEADPSLVRTPIIAFTANTLNNDFQKCIDCGMDYLMEKPFNSFKFFEVLNRLLAD